MTTTSWTTVSPVWKTDSSDSRLVYARCNRKCNCLLTKLKNTCDDRSYNYSPRKKAGIIMTSKEFGKFLIVQSKGRLWGAPKGGIEVGETPIECACREFREETGVDADLSKVVVSTELSVNQGKYFCIHNQIEHPVFLEDEFDSTGVGWITRQCMRDFAKRKLVKLTSDFKRILEVI
jgi:8-oxo-dGTP pyrophosphatase MutT (NUDIX family)